MDGGSWKTLRSVYLREHPCRRLDGERAGREVTDSAPLRCHPSTVTLIAVGGEWEGRDGQDRCRCQMNVFDSDRMKMSDLIAIPRRPSLQ